MTVRAWCVVLASAAMINSGALAQTAVHGSADAFAAAGVALAWAVARGTTESEASVVLRIVTEPTVFQGLAVVGIDPFSKQEKIWRAAAVSPGSLDVRVLRAQFADFPRTEIRLFASTAQLGSGTPAVIVFYLGVPDTTPEFSDHAKLDAYLMDRFARMRTASGGRAP